MCMRTQIYGFSGRRIPHQLTQEANGSHHPLELQLEGSVRVEGGVVAHEAPLGTIAATLNVRVKFHVVSLD